MKSLALLCLLTFSPQQSNKPETVALFLGEDPVRRAFVQTDHAERLYDKIRVRIENNTANEEDRRLFAALTLALGTLPRNEVVPNLNTRERMDWEVRRGVRPALQKADPRRAN